MFQYYKIRIGKTNTYLLQSEFNFYILIDTCPPSGTNQLIYRLKRLGVSPSNLKYIVITHSHYDHTGALAALKNFSNAQVIAHHNALPYLSKGISPFPRAVNPLLDKLIKTAEHRFPNASTYQPLIPDHTFSNRFDLHKWGIKGYLIHTPGHTTDSISLIHQNGHAFVGDTLFHICPGVINPPFQEDPQALLRSWKLLQNTGSMIFHPGHGLEISAQRLSHAIKKASREAL